MIERTFTIGHARAVMSLDDTGAFRVCWAPHMPIDLRGSDLCQYHSSRNAVIDEMREVLAGNGCLAIPYLRATWKEAATP
jgi:hypothetical protein